MRTQRGDVAATLLAAIAASSLCLSTANAPVFSPVNSMPRDHHLRPVKPPAAPAPSRPAPPLTDADRRAILSVCDELIGSAGRTTLALALRGSRAKRVLQHHVDQARGYGLYAGAPESEVLARIDALIAEGVLRLEYHDGFPLLG